ncbi:MAG TPA: hypothetical protein VFB58_12215 [Chloroflexota bacterium]|nr:hypothetical protein [Chloroflexota bacterium]
MWGNRRQEAESPAAGAVFIKRGLLLFWSIWITLVVITNVAGELRALHLASWLAPLASGNFRYILKETSAYSLPWWIDQILFIGILLWESLSAVLFWRAFRHAWRGTGRRLRAAYTAHGVLMALFAAFILADEIFHDFRVEGDHRSIVALLIVSLLAIGLLPER